VGPTNFEKAVFEWIAANSTDTALQLQLSGVQVATREHTGVGCYSQLVPSPGAPRTQERYGSRGPLDGPGFQSPVLRYGGSTLLWFKDGLVDCLEIFTYDDDFPFKHDELGEFHLFLKRLISG
jgi:hypothetical protein